MSHPFHIVDVFTDERYTGNQLAVVFPSPPLADDDMQRIAREFNFSETTFVHAFAAGAAEVRIFTPARELPFAGHPTIGTAWILAHVVGQLDAVTLRLKAGEVPVEFRNDVGWMVPPTVTVMEELDHADVAAATGLGIEHLNTSLPVVKMDVGPRFILVPFGAVESLGEIRIDSDAWDERLGGGLALFLFAPQGSADAKGAWRARMLSKILGSGVIEDPATGSANTCFAAYLREHVGMPVDATVHQGVEMGRASTLYLRADADNIEVGGRVVLVANGELV